MVITFHQEVDLAKGYFFQCANSMYLHLCVVITLNFIHFSPVMQLTHAFVSQRCMHNSFCVSI